jgi:hypothetical protein
MKCINRIFNIIVTGLLFSSCIELDLFLDQNGINSIADSIVNQSFNPDPEKFSNYIKNLNLDTYTNPDDILDQITIKDGNRWNLAHTDKKNVIHETVTFPSSLDYRNSSAVFYLFRQGPLGENPVILWVPGSGVSDFAFYFIQNFFKAELTSGYDILVYIPPYHMDRKEVDKKNGEGFFSADPYANITVMMASIQELRTAVQFLEQHGVDRIGGWGGSMGAAMLMLTSSLYQFDHISLMIPVVDWSELLCSRNEFMPYCKKLYTWL